MDSTPQELDLTPEIINIELQQGTDVAVEFQLTDDLGAAADISLDIVKFTAKDGFAGTVTIPTKENGPDGHSDPSDGKTIFVLTKSNLTTSEPDGQVSWKYEIRRVFSGSNREVIYIHGDLFLMPSVGLST